MAESSSSKKMMGFGSTPQSQGKSFWKRGGGGRLPAPGSVKPVFGAQHPPLNAPIDAVSSPAATSKQSVSVSPTKSTASRTFSLGVESRTDSSRTRSASYDETVPAAGPTPASLRDDSVSTPSASTPKLPVLSEREALRLQKFVRLIEGTPQTPLEELNKISWSGIPYPIRHTVWKLLSGYLPANVERRQATLERKRNEYRSFVKQYYHTRLQDQHQQTFHQITIDIPRMNPTSLFQQTIAQECFERLLYIWAMRHPASSYVQGMNDLATPFFVIFLGAYLDPAEAQDAQTADLSKMSKDAIAEAEADTYWCLTKLMDGIQDNYTFAQPGIQVKVHKLKELVKRIDAPLFQHLEDNNITFLEFTFRWMNNLLIREVPLQCIIRLWDTYLCERDGFATFHPYVCAAFLVNFSKELRAQTDFQGLMIYLQNLPTSDWDERQMNEILASAFQWKYSFNDAPNHLG
ncbi:TBC1 domain family member 22A-like [Sycon ciliatum]|uniref:TBC1 domain family member 22A-like n=1 Tax=Sycon ciliatum TaxID=27933 RepID=UPI0020A9EBCB|eukprot:scpid67677/ scgid31192/ TBC1 domain family member 22A